MKHEKYQYLKFVLCLFHADLIRYQNIKHFKIIPLATVVCTVDPLQFNLLPRSLRCPFGQRRALAASTLLPLGTDVQGFLAHPLSCSRYLRNPLTQTHFMIHS